MSGNPAAASADISATTAAGTSPFVKRSIANVDCSLNCTAVAPAATMAVLIVPLDAEYVSSIAMLLPVKSETDAMFRRAIRTATKPSSVDTGGLLLSAPAVATAACSWTGRGTGGMPCHSAGDTVAPWPSAGSETVGAAAVVAGSAILGEGRGNGMRDDALPGFDALGAGVVAASA